MGTVVDGLSDCAKGVNSGRLGGAKESVEFGRGGRWALTVVCQDRMLWRLWQRGGSGAEMSDGRWGRNGATARRASTPDDGRWGGMGTSSAEVGGAEIIYGVRDFLIRSLW
jgi:hypothetical protein